MLSHKLSLCKFNKIEIILRIFSEHNTMILEINYKKKNFRKHKHMKANDILLNNKWVTEDIKEEIKKKKKTWREIQTQTQ